MFLKRTLKEKLKRVLPEIIIKPLRYLYLEFGGGYAAESYSQEGEDLLIMSLLGTDTGGFYVDVGAHHPKRYSNTMIFYRSGWTGINIEPNPEAMKVFRTHRKRDINLCMGVGMKEDMLQYYMLDEPAMNSFNRALIMKRVSQGRNKLLKACQVPVWPLKVILNEWVPNRAIDFLNVDAEGMDLEVLQSNDWDRFRPYIVLVELLGTAMDEINTDAVYSFLSDKGYRLIAKTTRTGVFYDSIVQKRSSDR